MKIRRKNMSKIKDINISQYVLSYNILRGKYEYKKVLDKTNQGQKEVTEYLLDDKTSIKCTPDHKILTKNADYQSIDKLSEVVKIEKNANIVNKVSLGLKTVYDITVDTNHNFILKNGAIVKNCGAQTPFSSINYGTCTTPEGRMIIKNVLCATAEGLGHGETPIFPVQVFKMKKGINWNPEDPNYDLMKHAIKCSAKRLFPNFAFLDAPYNLQYYKKDKPETEVAVMGMTAFGNVKLRCKNSFFDSDICHVRKWLIDNHLVQKEMKKFDKNTYYYDLTGVEIYDGVNGFVNCKKYMICDDTRVQWYSIEILSNTNNIIHLKLTDDHPVVGYSFANESGEDDIYVNGKMFKRLQVKQLKYGDYILLENKNIGVIQNIHKVDPFIGYDFETETDIFALNGIISHNCRTRVISNHFDPEHEQVTGRGNFAFCTINLPRLGIEANHDINKFFELFDHRIDQAIGSLKDRFELIGHKHVYNYPFLMGQNVYLTSENLNYNDEIKEVIKQASISVGFIGLAECLVALIGKHHGESDEAQELGLKIVKHLRQRMDEESEKTGLNWSAFATPAEGLSGRFIKIDRKKYGVIPGVTDRDFYTNSSHIPVYYKTNFAHKIDVEAPYHELCNAGHIGYVEMDGNPNKNLQAYESIVKYAGEKGMTYFSINTQNDRCPVCGYLGIIDDVCPRCGFKEGEGVSVEHLKACGCWNAIKKLNGIEEK